MNIGNWFRGFRAKNASDKTIPSKAYKDKPYSVTKHAVQRMNERSITKGDVHTNLHTKPIHKSDIKYDSYKRPSYNRSSDNKITTSINPKTKSVVTVHRLHTDEHAKMKSKKRR